MEYIKKYWYQIALLTYLSICLFDFIGVPIILVIFRASMVESMIELQKTTAGSDILPTLARSFSAQAWIPFTLRGAGMFHLAFGALLTGTGMTKAKKDNPERLGMSEPKRL